MDEREGLGCEGRLQAGWMQIEEYSGARFVFVAGLAVLCVRSSRETGHLQSPIIGKTSGGKIRSSQLLTLLVGNADCSVVTASGVGGDPCMPGRFMAS